MDINEEDKIYHWTEINGASGSWIIPGMLRPGGVCVEKRCRLKGQSYSGNNSVDPEFRIVHYDHDYALKRMDDFMQYLTFSERVELLEKYLEKIKSNPEEVKVSRQKVVTCLVVVDSANQAIEHRENISPAESL